MSQRFDVAIVGAGAAGMFCAGILGQRGRRVALIDHASRIGEKIRISGGGRCNFTNVDADRIERFQSADPRFARHALRAYPPQRFVALVGRHRIAYHEKHRGQLFCDDSSEQIIAMLRRECPDGMVRWFQPCGVTDVAVRSGGGFALGTDAGTIECGALVVATGGLSIPKIGASDFGYRLARRFGLRIVEPRPALVPLTFDAAVWQPFAQLAGLSLEVGLRAPQAQAAPDFVEDLLFTHRGLSGPAVLQISTFWRPGEPLSVDLHPEGRIERELGSRREHTRQQLGTALAEMVPRRLAQAWLEAEGLRPDQRLAELGNRTLERLGKRFHDWRIVPSGTEGYRKAEVTSGGVATGELDPRSMQAKRVPGLFFVGEVVDVTGWLGGYNFQWAWASAYCTATAIADGPRSPSAAGSNG